MSDHPPQWSSAALSETRTPGSAERLHRPDCGCARATLALLPDLSTLRKGALADEGIDNDLDLIVACFSPTSTRLLAEKLAIETDTLCCWAGLLDLLRIQGLPRWAADLLLLLGIRSTQHLATAQPDDLALRIAAAAVVHGLTCPGPTVADLSEWSAEAARVPALRWL